MTTIEPQVIPSLLSASEVDAIRKVQLERQPGTIGGHAGAAPAIHRQTDVGWLTRPDHDWLFDRLSGAAAEMAGQISDDLMAPLASIQMGRYGAGGHYGWHQDAADASFSRYRRVSMSVVLQHAETGGVLEIQGRDLPAVGPGDCVIFPSSLMHRVTPVEAGARESLVAWFERRHKFDVRPDLLTPDEVGIVAAGFTDLEPSLHGGQVIPGCTHRIRWLEAGDPQWQWLFWRLVRFSESLLPGTAMVPDTMMLAEYDEGEHYHMHPDSERDAWTESRMASVSVLIEAADAGGDFEFQDHGPVPMKAGDGLVFDSAMQHTVRPVSAGRRRAVVFWMRAV